MTEQTKNQKSVENYVSSFITEFSSYFHNFGFHKFDPKIKEAAYILAKIQTERPTWASHHAAQDAAYLAHQAKHSKVNHDVIDTDHDRTKEIIYKALLGSHELHLAEKGQTHKFIDPLVEEKIELFRKEFSASTKQIQDRADKLITSSHHGGLANIICNLREKFSHNQQRSR